MSRISAKSRYVSTRNIKSGDEILGDYGPSVKWFHPSPSCEAEASESSNLSDPEHANPEEVGAPEICNTPVSETETANPEEVCDSDTPKEDEICDSDSDTPVEDEITLYDKDGSSFKVPRSYVAKDDLHDIDDPDFNPHHCPIESPSEEENMDEEEPKKEVEMPPLALANPAPAEGEISSEEVVSETSPPKPPSANASMLVACPSCNHSYCAREVWRSRFEPASSCGHTITPAGRRFAATVRIFIARPPTPRSLKGIPMGSAESPVSVDQLGLPPPPPPPPRNPRASEHESDSEFSDNDANLQMPPLVDHQWSSSSESDFAEPDSDSDLDLPHQTVPSANDPDTIISEDEGAVDLELPMLVTPPPSSSESATDSESDSGSSSDSDSSSDANSSSDSENHDSDYDDNDEPSHESGNHQDPSEHGSQDTGDFDSSGDADNDEGGEGDAEDLSGWSDVEEVDNMVQPDNVDQPPAAPHRPVNQIFQENWEKEMAAACDSTNQLPTEPEKIAEDWFEKLCSAARAAAKRSLPVKAESKLTQRMVSQRTKDLIRKKRLLRKDKKALKRIKAEIKESCLLDFKTWVSNTVSDIEKTNELGDVRKILNLANLLANKPKPPPCNLTEDDEGNLLNSPEDTVERWRKFLEEKFKATPAEDLRQDDPEELPKTEDKISWEEFENAVKHLKVGKASYGP